MNRPKTVSAVAVLMWVAIAIVLIACVSRSYAAVVGGFIMLIAGGVAHHAHSMRRLRDRRKGDSICTFARSMCFRNRDTWVLRAVYEAFDVEFQVPIKSSDRFREVFGLDDEELDDFAYSVAARARRSMVDTELNPYFNRVYTVEDMIKFFEHQPKIA